MAGETSTGISKKKAWGSGEGSVTLTYESGSGNGTITVTSDSNNLHTDRSMTVTVKSADGRISRQVTVAQAMKPYIDLATATVSASNQTYSGSAKTPTVTVTLNGSTVPSTGYDVEYTNNTKAGDATITITGKGDYTGTATGTFNIAKASPNLTVPSAKNLTYSGSTQTLVNAGSSSHGTFTYSTSQTGTYSTTIPQGIAANSYIVYWQFTGDSNHTDISPKQVTVSIAQKNLTITAKEQTITYGNSISTGTSQVATSGLVSGDSLTAVTLTPSTTDATTSGNIIPSNATTSNGIGNYDVSYVAGTLTINKATPTYTAPTAKTNLKYNGSAQALLNAGTTSHGTIYYSSDNSTWSTTIPTGTSVKSYTVYWKLTGDSNHTDIASKSITVAISQGTGSLAFVAATYNVNYVASPSAKLYASASLSGWEVCPTSVKSLSGYTVYRSVSNKAASNSQAVMKLTFYNTTGAAQDVLVKVGPCTESLYDYVYISAWDSADISPTINTVQSGAQYSGSNVTTEWTDVTLTVPAGTHTVQVVYRKDGSVSNSPDCGYLAIAQPLNFSTLRNMLIRTGSGTVRYSSSKTSVATVDSSTGVVTLAGTGKATITATMAATTNYSGATATFTVSSTAITKIAPSYAAPTAKSNLTYTGSAQALLNSGSTLDGTIQYSSNNSSWSTTIPTGTTATSYTRYWKLVGDSFHSDVASSSLSISIAKASRTISFSNPWTEVAPGATITNTATPSAGSGDGTVTYSSGNTSIVTVNSSTGAVTGVAEGSTFIQATISAGTNYKSATTSYTITCVQTVTDFAYTGAVQSITLNPGTYKLQCWGAQGGSNAAASAYSITAKAGGKGGYSEGVLTLSESKTLYVFVGGQGSSSGNGGWNGGGGGSGSASYNNSGTNGVSRMGCGGGATDIALVTSDMAYYSYRNARTSASLLSRIIVAGGGSGAAMCYKAVTSSSTSTVTDYTVSGSLMTATSYNGDSVSGSVLTLSGTTTYSSGLVTIHDTHEQTTTGSTTTSTDYGGGYVGGGENGGYYSMTYRATLSAAGLGGAFGLGANQTNTNYRYCSGCGGGGWYGGGGGLKSDTSTTYVKYMGGGSGFVNTSDYASYRPTDYTGLQLDSGTTYAGTSSFESISGGTETGHSGNGYARITRLS